MKVAAVSGDLLVKLAIGAGLVIALATIARKGLTLVPDHLPAALDPTSSDNLAYSGVNALGNAIASTEPGTAGRNADGSWTLGGAVFDWLHPDTAQAVRDMSGPVLPPRPNLQITDDGAQYDALGNRIN